MATLDPYMKGLSGDGFMALLVSFGDKVTYLSSTFIGWFSMQRNAAPAVVIIHSANFY